MHGVQRPVGLEDDRVLFRLSVPEITHPPESAGHLAGIDAVDEVNAAAFAEEFVHLGIGDVDELHVANECGGIDTARAQDFVGADPCFASIYREFEVVADGCGLHLPDENAAHDETQREYAEHYGSERVVTSPLRGR